MLSLEDPLRNDLEHAYGAASDMPARLAKLFKPHGLTAAYWDGMWSALCHQCTTYSASFAACPHLVSAAINLNARQRFEAMKLAAGIVACEDERVTTRLPGRLRAAYRTAIKEGKQALAMMLHDKRHSNLESMKFLSMIAAFERRPQVYGLLQTVCGDFCCPVCDQAIVDPYTSLGGL
jgi:hypothetical protein